MINRALMDMLGIDETKKNQLTHEDFLSHFVDKKAMSMHLKRYTSGQMLQCIPARK